MHEQTIKKAFPDLQISVIGKRYLGSLIGTSKEKDKFMEEKVEEWCEDLNQLSDIAKREPQLVYSAFCFGLSKRWDYVCRKTPGVADRLIALEHETRESFVPAILNRSFSCTLPPR